MVGILFMVVSIDWPSQFKRLAVGSLTLISVAYTDT